MTTKRLLFKWIVVGLPLVGAFVIFQNPIVQRGGDIIHNNERCHHHSVVLQQKQQVGFSTISSSSSSSSTSSLSATTDGGGGGGSDIIGDNNNALVDSPPLPTIDTLPPTTNSSDIIGDGGGGGNTDIHAAEIQDVPYDSSSTSISDDVSVSTASDDGDDNNIPHLSTQRQKKTNNNDTPFFAMPISRQKRRKSKSNKNRIQTTTTTKSTTAKMTELSRRKMLELTGLIGTTVVTGSILTHPVPKEPPSSPKPAVSLIPQPVLKDVKIVVGNNNNNNTSTSSSAATTARSSSNTSQKGSSETPPRSTTTTTTTTGKLEPINLTQVAAETNINVTMACEDGCVQVDSNFTKIKQVRLPKWYPRFFPTPAPKVIKQINDRELLAASLVAGGVTEMVRTSILYPIQTIKVRIQTDIHNYTEEPPPIGERIKELGNNIRRFSKDGKLYAGYKPAILVLAPATGVYYGVRDVSKRMLSMIPMMGDIPIALMAALIADIISLCFRTPADALIVRLQAAGQSISSDTGDEEEEEELEEEVIGDWFGDSIKLLPMIIVTDLPYLLSKLFLNKSFIHGSIPINQYAEYAILSAMVAAFFTTPFDVVRTRILVDSDGNYANGVDGGSGEGVIKTMKAVMSEGEGGIANLFAGWFERILYLGIGRAWLEPLILIGYVGLRDTLLLEWF